MSRVYTRTDPRVRFWAKVDKQPDGCWIWAAGRDWFGYGIFWLDGSRRAHRLAYEWLIGPIPTDLVLDHICRNTSCVNAAHLEPVTPRENTVARGVDAPAALNARKTECRRGHPLSGSNVYLYGGRRHCRECKRVAGRESKRRTRQAAA